MSVVQSFKGSQAAFPEKKHNGQTHVFVDSTDVPEHFKGLDLTSMGGVRIEDKPNMIAFPTSLLRRDIN